MKDLDAAFKALADINRVRILKLLEKRKMCVCEIAFVLGVSQPAISKQLKKMANAGFVDSEQAGFWTDYFVSTKNEYTKRLLTFLSSWLNDDPVIRTDRRRAKQADREKLCCKR